MVTDQPVNPETGNGLVGRYLQRLSALRTERSTWLSHWQEINDYIWPRRFRYLTTDRNKGYKRNDKIINNKGTIAVRTLAAGMMSGITSPARPWFRFLAPDDLADDEDVKAWNDAVEKIVRNAYIRTNIYNVLHELYVVLAMFGTPAMYIEEDDQDDFRAYLFPVGQYSLAVSSKQRMDTIYREFGMTVGQLVEEFGLEKCSITVQDHFKNGRVDQWIDVVHAVEPNNSRRGTQYDSQNKPWRACWFEKSVGATGSPLRISGFDEFPVMAPRWFVTGEDVYGGSPGMDALGDVKALFLWERRKAQAIDKIVNPPMKAPMSLKAQRISLLPGDTTYVPDNVAGQKFEPAIQIDPNAITVATEAIKEHEGRIWSTFFADLFMAMLSDERQQPITAREVNELHDEKMLQLGPVLDRIHDELLTPLINRTVRILARRGKLPPLPAKLKGRTLKVEYISVMAQAQKLLGTAGIERLSSFVGSLSAVNKDVLDLIDFDAMIREYAEMLGVPVDLMQKDEVVQQLRQQRAAQQAQMQQAAMVQAGAQAAKTAGDVDTNNLGKVLQGIGAAPGGTP